MYMTMHHIHVHVMFTKQRCIIVPHIDCTFDDCSSCLMADYE